MGQIYDITPFTLLDFPDELACVVWISGCNFRCVYCHNPDIVFNRGLKEDADVLAFLRSRIGRLTGVVFSGGEATFYTGLPGLLAQAKKMGFKTKLDTNGSNPAVLRQLMADGLVDRVALDYKCPPDLADEIIGTNAFTEAFRESLSFLIEESLRETIAFEVRTTLSSDIVGEEGARRIIEDLDRLGYRGTYWLQNIATSGEKTIGNISANQTPIDKNVLPVPQNFVLGFRNFPEG